MRVRHRVRADPNPNLNPGLAHAPLASSALGLVNVAMTLVAIWAMYRAGRRVLLLCGWFGMCAAYLLLTCALVGASAGVA